jgi:hypothetical protein
MSPGWLVLRGASGNNLRSIDAAIPAGLFTCVTGVSGSGKSTLIQDTLYPRLLYELHGARTAWAPHEALEGHEQFDKVIDIDQSPIGRTPRSNPATYTGVFDMIRELFALTPDAKMRGYKNGRFSFNVKGGRCEACKGDGIIKIEMHFLPDVYVPCEVCKGRRYNRETLEVRCKGRKRQNEILPRANRMANDAEYLELILNPIRVCAQYRPKMGQGQGAGYSLDEFPKLYRADLFYSWFGLDNQLMYAAHKAAGGMTSVYRQIGIGCESLFRRILQDELGLSVEQSKWSYTIKTPGGKDRSLFLDARIPVASVGDATKRARVETWLRTAASKLGVAPAVTKALSGVVYEVRQGYKSKDSKRQNADIANASTAYVNGYLPCAVILSTQIDTDILARYRAEKWAVLVGSVGANDPQSSTYDFMNQVVGYDLAGFFKRNSATLKTEVDKVLKSLLSP